MNPLLIEGYASLFGLADSAGDIVRAGAFMQSLRQGRGPPMLLQHRSGTVIGRWTRIVEDSHGLYVRGLIEAESAGALVSDGLDGLSIGFRPKLWRLGHDGARELIEIDLVEISLVAEPMQGLARFSVVGSERAAA